MRNKDLELQIFNILKIVHQRAAFMSNYSFLSFSVFLINMCRRAVVQPCVYMNMDIILYCSLLAFYKILGNAGFVALSTFL